MTKKEIRLFIIKELTSDNVKYNGSFYSTYITLGEKDFEIFKKMDNRYLMGYFFVKHYVKEEYVMIQCFMNKQQLKRYSREANRN